MESENLIGIIELGNLNIKCNIFDFNSEDKLEVLSSSLTKTEGIHNSTIINVSRATQSIRLCISEAEKKAKVSLKKINVVVEQPEFLCTKFSKNRKIDGAKIQKEDIEFLLKEAKKQVILNDQTQSIIHIFNHNYIVDGKSFIEEPINIYADLLSHEMTFITIPKNNLKNIYQVFSDCDIEIERLISCTFALGAELLNENQLQNGSIIIDLGHDKTSLGLFKNLALVHSSTIPVGVNHIVKDISKVCSLNLEESKIINDKTDYSFKENIKLFDNNNYLKNNFFTKSAFRKVSKDLIINVIKARLDEIIEIIRKQIYMSGLNKNSGSKIFITGGGSRLINIEKYFSNFFDSAVQKLEGDNVNDKETYQTFVSCLGAFKIIKYGWETEAIPEIVDKTVEKIGFFAKVFGKS